MTDKFRVVDYDIIYLSYDEPNAERNYADLCQKVPWAKRVHGVKGSDAAHKACAEISETERFITVDGDNIIDEIFINQELEIDKNEDLNNCVISWAANNQINGLIYGNGGIKCWPKEYVLNMRTHEAAESKNKHAQVDFCWDTKYIQIEGCFSKIYNNATPQQAWRAGFREGVKMCLNQGYCPSISEFKDSVHSRNLDHLSIWQNIGCDVENGIWAIAGARQGTFLTMLDSWDYKNVQDFEYLQNFWETEVKDAKPYEIAKEYGTQINSQLDLPDNILDKESSKFFKYHYRSNWKNLGPMTTERQALSGNI
jgi:hypothetical protein